jgi:hypothetical protein
MLMFLSDTFDLITINKLRRIRKRIAVCFSLQTQIFFRIPARTRDFFFSKSLDWFRDPHNLFKWLPKVPSLQVRQAGRETIHSSP